MTLLLRLGLLAILAGAGPQLTQQTSIEGVVIAPNGTPISGANVELRPTQSPVFSLVTTERGSQSSSGVQPPVAISRLPVVGPDSRVATTGSDGRFQFQNISAGEYRLYATRRNGFVPGEYGQRTPTGTGSPLSVAVGQAITGITLTMTPTASISGHISEIDGEPAGYAFVQALKAVYKDGRRTLTVMQMVQADDRGDYRLYWLPPGEYFVGVRPLNLRRSSDMLHVPPASRFGTYEQQDRPTTTALVSSRVLENGEIAEEMFSAVYYPGTLDEQRALPITLHGGDNVAGIDVNVADSLVRAYHVRGTVIDGVTGQPVAVSLQVLPRTPPAILKIHSGRSDANGAFDIGGVPPGANYLVANGQGSSGLFAIDVGADVTGVIFKVWPGASIPVRLTIDGRGLVESTSELSGFGIALRRNPFVNGLNEPGTAGVPLSPPGSAPPPDGTFAFRGIGPGNYRVVLNPKDDLYIKSIWFGSQDALNNGLFIDDVIEDDLEIVLGTRAGTVDVRVATDNGSPAANATVAVVPDLLRRNRLDLYKSASTDAYGRVQLRGLAPGDYRVFAWEEVEPGAWQNAEFIRVIESRGRSIHIDEGTEASVDVTQIPTLR